jgi:hypothetical protein
MLGCVTVTGPPSAICFLKIGTALPRLPSTFPNRTETKTWSDVARLDAASTIISTMRLDAPITDVGLTALSVEMFTKCVTPYLSAIDTRLRLPTMLLKTASSGLSSISGTCLWAAVWRITSGR